MQCVQLPPEQGTGFIWRGWGGVVVPASFQNGVEEKLCIAQARLLLAQILAAPAQIKQLLQLLYSW